MAPILPISGVSLPSAIRPAGQAQGSSSGAFQDVFASAIQSVGASSQEETASAQRFLSGEGEELHTTIMVSAARGAQLRHKFLQVRNKVARVRTRK